MNPKISVIIPVYNVEEYLSECLDSVINQTLKDIEIICIDDGSTDTSGKILDEYALKDERIKVIHQTNQGPGAARNRGLECITGEYVAFMDADDYYGEENYYETLYGIAKESDADAVKGLYQDIDTGYKGYQINEKIEENKNYFIIEYLSAIFRRDLIVANNIRFPELRDMEDPVFTLRFSSKANTIKVTYDVHLMKRSRIGGITNGAPIYKQIQEKIIGLNIILDEAKDSLQPEEYAYVAAFWFSFIWSDICKNTNSIVSFKSYHLMKNVYKKIVYKAEFNNELKKINAAVWKRFNKPWKVFLENMFSIRNTMLIDYKQKQVTILGFKFNVKTKYYFSNRYKNDFIEYVLNNQLDKSQYVELTNQPYEWSNNETKLISFYLPQYHNFPENEDFFGKGFTEWSNVTKAVPQYIGHYQPHLPIDVGFYNLETTDIMKRQIELAKMYGIYGFAFYYYWFSGKKVMEKPIEAFLQDKSLDMPFFIFWANESWTRLWGDGAMDEVIYEQRLQEGDAERFMRDMLPFMSDERYIKINNKPLLIIYNTQFYNKQLYLNFIKDIRKIAKENGFDDLYIMTNRKPDMDYANLQAEQEEYNLDAIMEFIPGGIFYRDFRTKKGEFINKKCIAQKFDVEDYVKNKKYLFETNGTLYKGCFPMWDNTPRKCYKGAFIFESSPELYKEWLKGIISWTKKNHSDKSEQFVFINAWNEWAEGAHLEPDQKYGYAYLQATKEVLEECDG